MSQLLYPSILVIGAGDLGVAMAKALRRHPAAYDVSVLLPPWTTAQGASGSESGLISTLRALDIRLVPGDFESDSEDSLKETLSCFHTVIGCSGFSSGVSGLQTMVARLVLDAGVARYVPWQFGVDYEVLSQGPLRNIVEEQVQVRALLRSQEATSWIIVSSGIFMSALLDHNELGIKSFNKNKLRALGSWDTQITTTDMEDVASITTAILMERPEVKNEVCFVAGDTLSYGQIVNDYPKMYMAHQCAKELWSREYLLGRLAADPENELKGQKCIFASDTGIAWSKADSWNGRRGIQTKTVRQYLEQQLQAQLDQLERQCRCRMAMAQAASVAA